MRQRKRTIGCNAWLFLLMQFSVVHCLASSSPAMSQPTREKPAGTKKQQPRQALPQIKYGTDGLPSQVLEMREAIIGAVRSGQIEELRYAWELNELKPDLGVQPVPDPIVHWKQISGDGEGREVLAALGEILEAGYVMLPLGPDLENNGIFVWPYFAEVPLDKLAPAQEVELLRLVSPAAAKAMRATGKYAHWRLAIGADGTWHSFRREP